MFVVVGTRASVASNDYEALYDKSAVAAAAAADHSQAVAVAVAAERNHVVGFAECNHVVVGTAAVASNHHGLAAVVIRASVAPNVHEAFHDNSAVVEIRVATVAGIDRNRPFVAETPPVAAVEIAAECHRTAAVAAADQAKAASLVLDLSRNLSADPECRRLWLRCQRLD